MNKNALKFLLPLVAIVVIFEAVMLVNSLIKDKKKIITDEPNGIVTENTQSDTEGPAVIDLKLLADLNEIKLGESTRVKVNMLPRENRRLDALNIYVKYDPKAFDIRNLKFDSVLPDPTFSRISTARGLVVVNYLITQAEGFEIRPGEDITLLSFEATAKLKGDQTMEISSGKEMKESATMFVETESSKVLPYADSILNILVK